MERYALGESNIAGCQMDIVEDVVVFIEKVGLPLCLSTTEYLGKQTVTKNNHII